MAISADIFHPIGFSDCAGWYEDNHSDAFSAFRLSALYADKKSYKSGNLGITFESLVPAFSEARKTGLLSTDQARLFFEEYFIPCRIIPTGGNRGFVTGFYEPIIEASRKPDDRFRIPFYRVPDDLVKVSDANRPADLDPSFAFAKQMNGALAEYEDRRQIEQGSLNGRGLEIAYVEDRVDAFFAHVQGAARLKFRDEPDVCITYDAKTGHPFTGIGQILVDRGEIPKAEISMQSIRYWLRTHPNQVNDLLWRNRSYIFFREVPLDNPTLGPIAAAKVQLTGGRSMAVDKALHTFGTPFYVQSPSLPAFEGKPFSRLMIAQDTGSAILGAARGDLFVGSGDEAGQIAGAIRHAADFISLVPRQLVRE